MSFVPPVGRLLSEPLRAGRMDEEPGEGDFLALLLQALQAGQSIRPAEAGSPQDESGAMVKVADGSDSTPATPLVNHLVSIRLAAEETVEPKLDTASGEPAAPVDPAQGAQTPGAQTPGAQAQGTPAQGTPIQGTPIQGTPIQGTPIQEAPVQEVSVQGAPQESLESNLIPPGLNHAVPSKPTRLAPPYSTSIVSDSPEVLTPRPAANVQAPAEGDHVPEAAAFRLRKVSPSAAQSGYGFSFPPVRPAATALVNAAPSIEVGALGPSESVEVDAAPAPSSQSPLLSLPSLPPSGETIQSPHVQGPTTAPPVALPSVPDRIAMLIRSQPDGDHQVTVRLNPAELGEVQVRMHLHEGQVRVDMHVVSAEVRAMVAGQESQLRALLAAAGLDLTGFEVGAGLSDSPSRGQQWTDEPEANRSLRLGDGGLSEEPPAEGAPPSEPPYRGRINIRT